jgi:hypothetical protein
VDIPGCMASKVIRPGKGCTSKFGAPNAPGEDLANNWIKTNTGEGWFAYFRFYGPLQPYFDQTWVLPDIEKV